MVRCPACGDPLAAWRAAPPAERTGSAAVRIELVRCRGCGLARVAEIAALGDLGSYYETGAYRPGRPRFERIAAPLLKAFERQRLRLLRRALPSAGAVVDVGAGRGRFLQALVATGYRAKGIEPSQRGYQACVERGVPVERADIATARIEPGSLDGAVLWHVLEHLAEPRAALERIASWLVPGGVLLVGVPNIASLQAQVGGDRWFHLDLPRHLHHFTPRSLTLLLERCGLEAEGTRHLLLEHNQLGMWQTLLNRLTPTRNFFYNLAKRNLGRFRPRYVVDAGITVLIGIPLLPVAVLLELAAELLRRGGTIAVVARKKH